jgi:aspartate/methionine/tyrosine aminotransferase
MTLKISKRGNVPPFLAMEVLRFAAEREAAGEGVLHMEVGQPSTGAPRKVIEAAKRALEGEKLGYAEALGLPALRTAIAGWYRSRYGVSVPERRIAVTTGTSGAFLLAFLACFDPGDRIVMACPGYPAYRNMLKAFGVVPVEIPCGRETRWQPTVAMLEALPEKPHGLLVASPANPTGTILDRGALAELAGWCRANGVRFISDEIYHGITYGQVAAETMLALSDEAIVVNGFSKYFSMTGWRLGWLVLPDDMVRPVECLAQNLFISAPSLSQHAAIAAFDCVEELDGHVARYARNREILLDELPRAGFTDLTPADGGFFIYADVSEMTSDSQAFSAAMLAETGVAVTPGLDFDPVQGHRSVRFSFAGSTETMVEATRRLKIWYQGMPSRR